MTCENGFAVRSGGRIHRTNAAPAPASRWPPSHGDVITTEHLGGASSFAAMRRTGGTRNGRTPRAPFDDEGVAERFRDLVTGHRQRWLPGWIEGLGFAEPDEHFVAIT
ncbi:hypothetical protein [Streptomyces sp. Z26]|uniref:hypothetical protein n=1 Tax=Streptomyces sp. Z26 TaxID=2500177 RepID=UPI000FCCD360|nr:hypothetical protein [Streptomyces sp. Z26]